MVIDIRTIDFPRLLEKIETIRSTKALYTYHSYLMNYTGKHCELCVLPLNPYGVYLSHEQAICITCFNNYISSKDYLKNLKSFETRVSKIIEQADLLATSLKTNPQHIDLDLANKLFKELTLSEIEQMIGVPQQFGSFDYGIEAGKWKLNNFLIEIWFKNQICTEATMA
ncbi:hypothetical protein ABDJ41_18755 [Pedobacter sp. ASV1-7]|uniref:hypothetical protein n=1 Tax=Pedobacter sp. ASV1-7 TaxID=3145237 RepID=UPI0032E86BC0